MISSAQKERIIREILTDEEIETSIKIAKEVTPNAFAPYSNFHVGVCLISHDGRYYSGCNVENITLSMTTCAERTAIVKAFADGCNSFKACAVYAQHEGHYLFTPPCGSCRQLLEEFCTFLPIILVNRSGARLYTSLHELLPYAFVIKKFRPPTQKGGLSKLESYDAVITESNVYILKDNDAETRDVVMNLLLKWDFNALEPVMHSTLAFDQNLEFRGQYWPGYNQVNSVTIQLLSVAVSKYLRALASVNAESKINVVETIFDDEDKIIQKLATLAQAVFIQQAFKVIITKNLTGSATSDEDSAQKTIKLVWKRETQESITLSLEVQNPSDARKYLCVDGDKFLVNNFAELPDLHKVFDFNTFTLLNV